MSSKKPTKADDSDSDSDLSLHEEDFKESRVDVGLLDLDLDDLTADELRLLRIHMRSPFFPCKVGGKPAWLDHTNVPLSVGTTPSTDKPSVELKCDTCHAQLVFLLQIYAPISDTDKFVDRVEDIDAAFHRALYVFVCARPNCASRSFRALRSQLPRENGHFSYDPPPSVEIADDNNNSNGQLELARSHLAKFYKSLHEKRLLNLCAVCGLASSKKCAKCAFAYYCCQAHQLCDWTALRHKELCARYASGGVVGVDEVIENWVEDESAEERCRMRGGEMAQSLFPEHEIVIEPEAIDFAKLREKEFKYDEKKLAEQLESNDAQGMDQDLDALKESDYDKDFEKFKKISAQEADQVVRYERGGKPLWCTKYGKLKEANVPPCQHCGAKRIFEFQVTPQLLNYLGLDETKQLNNSIDWAGLYVFTCVRSCNAAKNSYASEFIYKQDFVS